MNGKFVGIKLIAGEVLTFCHTRSLPDTRRSLSLVLLGPIGRSNSNATNVSSPATSYDIVAILFQTTWRL